MQHNTSNKYVANAEHKIKQKDRIFLSTSYKCFPWKFIWQSQITFSAKVHNQ